MGWGSLREDILKRLESDLQEIRSKPDVTDSFIEECENILKKVKARMMVIESVDFDVFDEVAILQRENSRQAVSLINLKQENSKLQVENRFLNLRLKEENLRLNGELKQENEQLKLNKKKLVEITTRLNKTNEKLSANDDKYKRTIDKQNIVIQDQSSKILRQKKSIQSHVVKITNLNKLIEAEIEGLTKCQICREFFDKSFIEDHKRESHSDYFTFIKCEYCPVLLRMSESAIHQIIECPKNPKSTAYKKRFR